MTPAPHAPAFGWRDRSDDSHLATELVRCPCLALADALDLRAIERGDIWLAQTLVLMTNPAGQASSGMNRASGSPSLSILRFARSPGQGHQILNLAVQASLGLVTKTINRRRCGRPDLARTPENMAMRPRTIANRYCGLLGSRSWAAPPGSRQDVSALGISS